MSFVPRLALVMSLAASVACQRGPAEPAPPSWSEIEGIPADFADGIDNVRTDEEIRAAVVESDPTYAASPRLRSPPRTSPDGTRRTPGAITVNRAT